MFCTFLYCKSIYINKASNNNFAHNRYIFNYFCIYIFYNCSLNTLDTSVLYELNFNIVEIIINNNILEIS